jgi:RNA polymerase primary sigma factor
MACTGIEKAFDFLLKKSKSQGYVSLDDILSCGDFFSLEVDDIERLTDLVLECGIITNSKSKNEKYIDEDVNRKDYSSIYNTVVSMDPSLEHFINYVRNVRPADKREMVRIQYQILEGNKYARLRAVEGNLRVAVILAYRESIAYNKDIADCISDACFALVSACDSYKPDEHQTFASYISIVIIDYLARSMDIPLFIIPTNVVNLCRKLSRDHKYNSLEKNEALMYACSYYGIEKYWSEVIYNILHLVLLEKNILYGFPEKVYSENCYETFDSDVENDIERKIVQNLINQALEECLSVREKNVVEKRFGLNGEKVHSLEVLGSFFEVSKERIRQVVKNSLTKLKKRKGWFEEKMAFNIKGITQCCDDVNDCGDD